MAELDYIIGRKAYARPQAMLLSNNPGYISGGKRIPDGKEFLDFIILSDDNRSPISFQTNRLERRERTINGRMRSYHIADKLSISTSWKALPSRASSAEPVIDQESGQTFIGPNDLAYTADNGAGGVDLLNWYENHQGSFWVFLAYDKLTNFSSDRYNKMGQYNEIIEVFFEDFQYDVVNRGRGTHDFWDISLSLEEV